MIKNRSDWVFLGLLLGATSWSLLNPSLFRVHDFLHAARTAEMLRALQDGQFPVRWVSSFGYGYGMPLFEFYGPLPSYVSAFFYWITGSILFSVKMLFVIANLVTAIGAYRAGKVLSNNNTKAGLLAAALITLSPYRAVNLFVRGAVSEAWGMMILPWIIEGIYRQVRGDTGAWKQTLLATAILLLSHNLTALMFLPLSGILVVAFAGIVLSQKNSFKLQIKRVGLVLATYLLAVSMTLFYTLPSFVEKNFTKINHILEGYFQYWQHFLAYKQFFQPNWGYGGSAWGPVDGISFFLGWGVLLGVVSISLAGIWRIYRDKSISKLITQQQKSALIMFAAAAFTLFLSLQRSSFIWDSIELLSYIQFPWRFLALSTTFLGLAIAISFTDLMEKSSQKVVWLGMGIIIVSSFIHTVYFQPESYLDNPDELYYTDQTRISSELSATLPDYIPENMSDNLQIPPGLIEENPRLLVESVLVDRSNERLLSISANEATMLAFTIADFPGWRVELDGEPVQKLSPIDGRVTMVVPHGSHQVGAIFGWTALRYWSDVVSVLSVGCVGIIVLKSRHESNRD